MRAWPLIAIALMMTSCNFREVKEGSVLTANFSSIQAIVIKPKCITCHVANGQAAFYPMTDHASVVTRVSAGDAFNSLLYRRITVDAPIMPLGGTQLGNSEKRAFYDWIQNGAKND